jgi:glycosyltransferase involved in cell wall biosynthesis
VHAAWRAPLRKIVISGWLFRRALEIGVAESSMTVIHNAVAHDVFRLLQPIEERPPGVAMLYSSPSYKGGDIGIEMLRRVKVRVPDLRATLFGVEAAPRRLPDWVTYIRSATPAQLTADVYNRSAIYLCPSLSEGWHLPGPEAMACGCALVASDIGGVQDYADDGDTALLYPAGDVAAGADRVTELLLDENRRATLAHQGRDRISTLSWDRSADRLSALLEAGVHQRRERA